MPALSRWLPATSCRPCSATVTSFVMLMTLGVILTATAASAETRPPPAPEMTDEFIAAVVDSTAAALAETYVYPDVALEMEKRIRDRPDDESLRSD